MLLDVMRCALLSRAIHVLVTRSSHCRVSLIFRRPYPEMQCSSQLVGRSTTSYNISADRLAQIEVLDLADPPASRN